MADAKISALDNLTSADPANDMIPIVDVSATPPASGNTKRISINNLLACSPTATLASASITGAATVGTTLGVTGNSTLTGSVGIGVAPAQKLTVLVADAAQSAQFRAASGYVRLRPYVDATNGGIIDATNTSESAYSNLTILANSLRLFGNSASGLTVGATGNVTVGAGNLVMATSGKGIDFSAVTGGTGTATANVLNDYEEGTFTPTIVGTTIAGVGVYSSQNAKYTKVGNLVTCYIYLAWTAHTGTGDIRIGGLPFATASASGVYYAASIGFATNIALTAGYVMTGYALDNSSTLISLQQYPTGGGASISVPIDVSGGIIVSISYAT